MDKTSIAVAAIIVIVIAAIIFYFSQPSSNNLPLNNSNASVSNEGQPPVNNSYPIQPSNPTVSYNDSDAFNDLANAAYPMLPILIGTSFLNDSNASSTLQGVVSNLTAFESSSNLSTLSGKGFFTSYAGAVVELTSANQDYLNALTIQENQTTTSNLCGNRQTYVRSLFFINKSVEELMNASAMLNSTVSVYPALSAQINVNVTVINLVNFAIGIQKEELKDENLLNNVNC